MGKAPTYDTLYQNDWVELIEVKWPERGVNGYSYLHERRCKGKIIAILPYRQTREGIEFLLRVEVCPAWGFRSVKCSITGGYETFDPRDTAVMELEEEAGYSVDKGRLIELGTCRATKSTDTVYYLYAVDVTDLEQGEAKGDGSRLEAEGSTHWTLEPLNETDDPFVFTMWAKLLPHLTNEGKTVLV